jgi:hypothetical protein
MHPLHDKRAGGNERARSPDPATLNTTVLVLDTVRLATESLSLDKE